MKFVHYSDNLFSSCSIKVCIAVALETRGGPWGQVEDSGHTWRRFRSSQNPRTSLVYLVLVLACYFVREMYEWRVLCHGREYLAGIQVSVDCLPSTADHRRNGSASSSTCPVDCTHIYTHTAVQSREWVMGHGSHGSWVTLSSAACDTHHQRIRAGCQSVLWSVISQRRRRHPQNATLTEWHIIEGQKTSVGLYVYSEWMKWSMISASRVGALWHTSEVECYCWNNEQTNNCSRKWRNKQRVLEVVGMSARCGVSLLVDVTFTSLRLQHSFLHSITHSCCRLIVSLLLRAQQLINEWMSEWMNEWMNEWMISFIARSYGHFMLHRSRLGVVIVSSIQA